MVSASSLTREKPNFFLSPMTSVFHRPTAVGGSPEPGNNPEQRSREATNRVIANLTTAMERHHRRNMASQEALSVQAKENQHRTDVGVGEVLKMQMEMAEEQLAQRRLIEQLISAHQQSDFIVVPREERQYTEDPDEEL